MQTKRRVVYWANGKYYQRNQMNSNGSTDITLRGINFLTDHFNGQAFNLTANS